MLNVLPDISNPVGEVSQFVRDRSSVTLLRLSLTRQLVDLGSDPFQFVVEVRILHHCGGFRDLCQDLRESSEYFTNNVVRFRSISSSLDAYQYKCFFFIYSLSVFYSMYFRHLRGPKHAILLVNVSTVTIDII